jgi:hypothetical protein
MKKFGDMVCERGTGGITNEIILKRRVSGGFIANTGRVAAALDLNPILIGTFDEGVVEPAFNEFAGKTRMYSIGGPSVCHIFEFSDGKIMLPYIQRLMNLTWDEIQKNAASLETNLTGADVVAVGYWALMPGFDGILQGLYENYFVNHPPKRLFFDFADITMRGTGPMKETFKRLSGYKSKIIKTISLNEHEAALLFECYGEKLSGDMNAAAESAARVRERIFFDELIVHTPFFAAAASSMETAAVKQNYCEAPVRTAGAGDSFNGGYIAACCSVLSLAQRLAVANAVTHYFVANGSPPDRNALAESITDFVGL